MISASTKVLNTPGVFLVRIRPRKDFYQEKAYYPLIEVLPDPTNPSDGLGRWFVVEICKGRTRGFFETEIMEVISVKQYEEECKFGCSSGYDIGHATCYN